MGGERVRQGDGWDGGREGKRVCLLGGRREKMRVLARK